MEAFIAERRNAERGLIDVWTEGPGGPRTAGLVYRRVRYRGRRRNEVDFVLNLIAYHWKRSPSLAKAG